MPGAPSGPRADHDATNCCWRAGSSDRRRAAERAQRAFDPLRRLRRAHRTRSGRHARRRTGARQPFDPSRDRRLAGRGATTARRGAERCRLRRAPSRRRPPTEKDGVMGELVRALAVAGFASANVMMLSVGVWSGADAGSRDVFHWLSAAIALPTLAYSGRVFFRSAWQAIRRGRTNMDVPISVGVLLAFGMSLYETVHHGPHAYFDAAISLLFVLLIGRTLDHVMRERARTAVKGLARLAARGAWVVEPDGTRHYLAVDAIRAGHDHSAGRGRSCAGGCPDRRGTVGARRLAGVGREPAAAGRARRAASGGHAQPDGTAEDRGDGGGRRVLPGRDDAHDGSGRGRPRRLPAPGRSGRAALCAGDPRHRARSLRRLDAGDRRCASRTDHCHRRPDHHLPLRARPRRAHGPGRRGAAPVRARHHGQGRRRAGAPRRGGSCRLRQDRHAHRAECPNWRIAARSIRTCWRSPRRWRRTRVIPMRRPSPPRDGPAMRAWSC